MNPFGVPIYVTDHVDFLVPDWSGCRSPSRAKRRHRQGHKTRMVLRSIPQIFKAGNRMLMSPKTMAVLKSSIEARIMRDMMLSGESTTYTHVDEESAKLTVDIIKESIKKIGKFTDHAPDIFALDPYKPITWDFKSRRYW